MRGACQTGREIARELRDAKCAFDRLEVEYRDRNKDTAYSALPVTCNKRFFIASNSFCNALTRAKVQLLRATIAKVEGSPRTAFRLYEG